MSAAPNWAFFLETGVFVPFDEQAAASAIGRVTTQPRFGLLTRSYPTDDSGAGDQQDWTRFAKYVNQLNVDSPSHVQYKVLYLTRHGFGFHNKMEKQVGTAEWDRYWSFLDEANGEVFFDASLTDEGIQQAKDLSKLWLTTINEEGAPMPSTLYCSPLQRCLQTCLYSLTPLMENHGREFRPLVMDKLRERMTMHTCDKRHPRSWIQDKWPQYEIGPDVSEIDELGQLNREETYAEHALRKQKALAEIFDRDQGQFLSLTTHSQAINALLEACGGQRIKVREGTTLAVLVRGEKR